MKKWRQEEFRLISLNFANFRLFSAIFAYFRLFSKSVYQVKKISQFRLLTVLSLFLERFFFGNHLFSDFIILFVNFGFYANLSYSIGFCLWKIFNLFYERNRIEPWTSRLKSRNMLETGKRKTNLGLSV